MKIRTQIDNIVGRYNVQVDTYGLTTTEEQRILDFGDPLIDAGGNFAGSLTRPGDGSPTSVDFDLPTATRRMKNDSPFKQVFDLEDDVNSDIKAKIWADTIAARLTAAKDSLIARTSPYEGETVVTV